MESTESLLEAIDDFSGAVIIVTHSEMILHALATRLIVFDDGKVSLFEGTYKDFLDRIGWKSENKSLKPEAGARESVIQPLDKKLRRRIRAELINEKSKTLGTLQRRIEEIEGIIISLEKKVNQDNSDLIDASTKGDGEMIKELSKAVHEARSKIESLFAELEDLHSELDRKKKRI